MLKFLPLISIAMYVAACCLPAMTLTKIGGMGTELWYGFGVLCFGWMGIPLGTIVWFANIFWLAGTVFLLPSRGKIVAVTLLAIALALALLLPEFTNHQPRFSQRLHSGAYLWLASIATQFGVAVYATAMSVKERSAKLSPVA